METNKLILVKLFPTSHRYDYEYLLCSRSLLQYYCVTQSPDLCKLTIFGDRRHPVPYWGTYWGTLPQVELLSPC